MNENLTIRNAATGDLQDILAVYNDAILHTTAVYQEEPHTLEMRQAWFDDKQKTGLPVFVAEVDGRFAGFSTYGPFRIWPGYRFTIEHSVYVVGASQGKGIGRRLVQAVIDDARRKNMHVIIAGIDAAGEASIGLHLSLGFKEVAHFKEVGFKFNRWLDVKFFELLL